MLKTNWVRVEVDKGGSYSIPSKLSEAIKYLQDALNKIPPEFQAEASLDISYDHGYYDSVEVKYEIYYYRPETDEEATAREAVEKAAAEHLIECEKLLFESLKKKFQA